MPLMDRDVTTDSVVKRGSEWCVVHGHEPKSAKDKPKGSVIKCFPTEEKALAMHRAIMASKSKDSLSISEIERLSTSTTLGDKDIARLSQSDLKLVLEDAIVEGNINAVGYLLKSITVSSKYKDFLLTLAKTKDIAKEIIKGIN